MAILKTYDLKGNKQSFANWISNLSPVETPFASMIGKEAVDQVMYSWQTDRLSAPSNTGVQEGANFAGSLLAPTSVHTNFTQILRKVVSISDTANKVGLYGRASEKAYQMEKVGKELKRDLETAMLTQVSGTVGAKGLTARRFSGFQGLVAKQGQACADTGAVVHKMHTYVAGTVPFDEDVIFDLTYNLYLAGAKANKIMIHPVHMILFSKLINDNRAPTVHRMFENLDAKYNSFVKRIRDPLGQEFELIPNRFMPKDKIYFFNEKDWTQMVLREPTTVELAKTGSSEKHMIEMEVGLRHRNPFASGILDLNDTVTDKYTVDATSTHLVMTTSSPTNKAKIQVTQYKNGSLDTTAAGADLFNKPTISGGVDGTGSGLRAPTDATGTWNNGVYIMTNELAASKAGKYVVTVERKDGSASSSFEVLVHSPDTRGAVTMDEKLEDAGIEVPVAVKASKAKAKK